MDHWTFFGLFFDHIWTIFLNFFGPILSGGGRPLELREGWHAVYQYSDRGGRRTFVTEGGVEDELLVLREGWAVVVLVNATDNGVSLDHTNYFERLFD